MPGKYNWARFIRSRLFVSLLAPLLAVVMAFAACGLIILIFITGYNLDAQALERLNRANVPPGIIHRLKPLMDEDFSQKEAFDKELRKLLDNQEYRHYSAVITEASFSRENPVRVFNEIFKAALKDRNGWGNVLYRATPLILTGLAVALAVQCGLFNIGGEGQMVMGGFAIAWAGFSLTGLPSFLHIPLCILAGFLAGALWGGIAGVSQDRPGGPRGGHHHHAQLDRGGSDPVPDHGL